MPHFRQCEHVIPHAATNAAIGQADDVAAGLNADDQAGVDVNGAEVVHQDSDAKSVIAVKDVVEQGGLARAEKSGEHGYGSDRGIGVCVVVNHGRDNG